MNSSKYSKLNSILTGAFTYAVNRNSFILKNISINYALPSYDEGIVTLSLENKVILINCRFRRLAEYVFKLVNEENIVLAKSCFFEYDGTYEKDSIVLTERRALKNSLILANLMFNFLNRLLIKNFIYNLGEDFVIFLTNVVIKPAVLLENFIVTNPSGYFLIISGVDYRITRTKNLVHVFQGEIWSTKKNYFGLIDSIFLLSNSEFNFLELISTTDIYIRNTQVSVSLLFDKSLLKVTYLLTDLCDANLPNDCNILKYNPLCGNNSLKSICSSIRISNCFFYDKGSTNLLRTGNNISFISLDGFYPFVHIEYTIIILFLFNYKHFILSENLKVGNFYDNKVVGLGSLAAEGSSFFFISYKSESKLNFTINMTLFAFNKMSSGAFLRISKLYSIIIAMNINILNSKFDSNQAWFRGGILSFEQKFEPTIFSAKTTTVEIKLQDVSLHSNRVRMRDSGDISYSENFRMKFDNKTSKSLDIDLGPINYISMDLDLDVPPSFAREIEIKEKVMNHQPAKSSCFFVIRAYDQEIQQLDFKYIMLESNKS